MSQRKKNASLTRRWPSSPPRRYGAYLRKMAIDGYIIYTDTTEIKAFTSELSVIGRNINQIAKRLNAGDPVYQADMEEIRSIFSCHVEDGVPTDFLYRIHNFRFALQIVFFIL